ncbi:MAG: TIGR02147 family protein [Bdellovibrionales bacterium]|nr:TIGR02147 family protein [Bdellovibrionales bacterium]
MFGKYFDFTWSYTISGPMLQPTKDYRQILKEELETRMALNSSYSLRAFARDLAIAPSSLHAVLNGKHGLALRTAKKICHRLQFDEDETSLFVDLVQSEGSRKTQVRNSAAERIKKLYEKTEPLSMDYMVILSKWYHLAIVQLALLPSFQSDTQWIADSLGISEQEAADAIERLFKTKLLESIDNRWRPQKDFLKSSDNVSSHSIRSLHLQLLEKAKVSLTSQTVDERDISSLIFAIEKEQLPDVKKEIRNFKKNLLSKYANKPNNNSIFNLSISFFRLDQETPS